MDLQHWPETLDVACVLALLSGCVLVTLAHFVMEPVRWNLCYQPTAYTAESQKGVRDALFCTALATYILPFKLGIPLRIFLLRRHGELTLHFVGVVVALDGLISLFVWAVIAAACAWAAALHWSPPWYLWAVIVAGVLVCVIGMLMQRSLGLRMLQRLREALVLLNHPWQRITRAASILAIDVFSYGLRHALLVLLVTGDVWNMLVGGAIGIVATFAGIVSGLPMGLVGYDATLVALLALVGVPAEQAVLIALINRAMNLLSAVLLGVPAAMRLGMGTTLGSIIKTIRRISNDTA